MYELVNDKLLYSNYFELILSSIFSFILQNPIRKISSDLEYSNLPKT